MKRLFLLPVLLFFLLPAAPRTANADDGVYAVAAAQDVWFYAAEREDSKLFLLPYTYYVRVLSRGDVYSSVQYLDDAPPYRAVRGYCRTDSIRPVDFVPERPFLYRTVTLAYTLPVTPALGGGNFSRVERTFCYYGMRYEDGALLFYVHDENGVCDYIPANEPLVYELNTDYLSEEVPAAAESGASASPSAAQIVVICIACVAVVGIAVLVLRSKRSALPREEPEQ